MGHSCSRPPADTTVINQVADFDYKKIIYKELKVTWTFCNSMLPLLGQFGGERAFIIFHGAADEMFVTYLILSTETIRFSKKQPMYMVQKQNTIERQAVGKQYSIIEMTTGLQRQKDFNFLGTE